MILIAYVDGISAAGVTSIACSARCCSIARSSSIVHSQSFFASTRGHQGVFRSGTGAVRVDRRLTFGGNQRQVLPVTSHQDLAAFGCAM
jgi:hypothetical protein